MIECPSMNLSPTLSRNKKVEQCKRKKTHKPNVLKFWIEGSSIFLYRLDSYLILSFKYLTWINIENNIKLMMFWNYIRFYSNKILNYERKN